MCRLPSAFGVVPWLHAELSLVILSDSNKRRQDECDDSQQVPPKQRQMVDQDNTTTERDSTELAEEQGNIQGRSYTH